MPLLPLQKRHRFKCFHKEHRIQTGEGWFIGQKIKALGIKVEPLSSSSSCIHS